MPSPHADAARDLLRRRLLLGAVLLFAATGVLGGCVYAGELRAARVWYGIQVFLLIAFPWSTYLEVRRAWRGEARNDRDVAMPWSLTTGAGFVLLLAWRIFQ